MLSTRHRRVPSPGNADGWRTWGTPPRLDSIPLTVLTALMSAMGAWPEWAQMQDELAALSSDSEHITAREAGHYIHLDEPDLVVNAIRDLVSRCR